MSADKCFTHAGQLAAASVWFPLGGGGKTGSVPLKVCRSDVVENTCHLTGTRSPEGRSPVSFDLHVGNPLRPLRFGVDIVYSGKPFPSASSHTQVTVSLPVFLSTSRICHNVLHFLRHSTSFPALGLTLREQGLHFTNCYVPS